MHPEPRFDRRRHHGTREAVQRALIVAEQHLVTASSERRLVHLVEEFARACRSARLPVERMVVLVKRIASPLHRVDDPIRAATITEKLVRVSIDTYFALDRGSERVDVLRPFRGLRRRSITPL